jgi:hypothetical protein
MVKIIQKIGEKFYWDRFIDPFFFLNPLELIELIKLIDKNLYQLYNLWMSLIRC